MTIRYFARTLAILGAVSGAATLLAQQGAPNEGAPQQGPRLKIERDLEYARSGGTALKLDLYRQEPSRAPSPVIVWIHDNAATGKAPTPAAAFVTPGYAVASIEYDTSRGATPASRLATAKAAVRWLRANAATYNLDAAHIGAMGYGAGGEIAALLGVSGDVAALEGSLGNAGQSSRVQAVVNLAGPLGKTAVNAAAYASKDDAPTLILHGTADKTVSTWDSQNLVVALKLAGVNAQLDLQVGTSHELGELLSPPAMQSVTGFLDQHLRGVARRTGLSAYLSTPQDSWEDPVALDLGGTKYRTYPTPLRGPGTFASYRVYLPPDYDANASRRYPVIYFMHGSGQDSKRPITAGYIGRADAAIRSGAMPPAIIVLINGLNRNAWVDSKDGKYPMESVIIKNLIPHVDATYRTIATREARAVEGHSMGGGGAAHTGFKFPELFAATTINASGLTTAEAIATNPEPETVERFRIVFGNDRAYYESQAPATLAAKNTAALRNQQIRLIIGDQDPGFPRAQALHEHLTKLNIPHEFLPVKGSPHNHDQLLQYQTFDTMAFYGKVFAAKTTQR